MTPTDYANTPHARENREAKAQALADAARRLNVPGTHLRVAGGARGRVRREAGVVREPSGLTWALVVDLLAADGPPAQVCYRHPDRPARLYLGGLLCDEECAPWRVRGHEPHHRNPPEPLSVLLARRATAGSDDRKDQDR